MSHMEQSDALGKSKEGTRSKQAEVNPRTGMRRQEQGKAEGKQTGSSAKEQDGEGV